MAPRVLEACRDIGKAEYEDFVRPSASKSSERLRAMPQPVREKILQQERIYGARSGSFKYDVLVARNCKEPPKEWVWHL